MKKTWNFIYLFFCLNQKFKAAEGEKKWKVSNSPGREQESGWTRRTKTSPASSWSSNFHLFPSSDSFSSHGHRSTRCPSLRGQAPQLTEQKTSKAPHDRRRTAERWMVDEGSRSPEKPGCCCCCCWTQRSDRLDRGWLGRWVRGAEVSWELIQVTVGGS